MTTENSIGAMLLQAFDEVLNPTLDNASDDFVMAFEEVVLATMQSTQEEVDAFVARMTKTREKQAATRNPNMPEGRALVVDQIDILMDAFIRFVQLAHEHREVCLAPDTASN
jgi:hypothetical protein